MSDQPDLLPAASSDVAFARLAMLTRRGYRTSFPIVRSSDGIRIELNHPRASKTRHVPTLTLWSDGVVATNGLMWPEHYVPSDRVEPPTWQKCIAADDHATFAGFAASIARPGFIDLVVRPSWRTLQGLVFRLLFGSSLCAALALPIGLLKAASRG